MLSYFARRLLVMIPTLLVISLISFIIIQLPPGDYLTMYIRSLEASGKKVDQAEVDRALKQTMAEMAGGGGKRKRRKKRNRNRSSGKPIRPPGN